MPADAVVKIRPLAPEDKAQWSALWEAYLTFYQTALPEAVFDHSFARLTAPEDVMRGLVAEMGTKIVGLVHYIFHASCWKVEPVCYLQDLFTLSETRGKGVGRALIQAVYAKADEAGSPTVYWMTQEFNYAGRMLYDQVGVKTPFIRYMRPS